MDKINGYAAGEAAELLETIEAGKKEGKTLTSLFAYYGRLHGRASGSVRNYYYKLLHSEDEQAKRLLAGHRLRAARIRPFTEEETEEMLTRILRERSRGSSVRRAIAVACGGDQKKALRYQNKYRNLQKKQPERIAAAAGRLGLAVPVSRPQPAPVKRLEQEINALYDRLALTLRQENERLREAVRRLTEENELLRRAARG